MYDVISWCELPGIISYDSVMKSRIGTPLGFEPDVGTLRVGLGKRLPGPPSDWPAPDRTYLMSAEKVSGSRFQAHLCVY